MELLVGFRPKSPIIERTKKFKQALLTDQEPISKRVYWKNNSCLTKPNLITVKPSLFTRILVSKMSTTTKSTNISVEVWFKRALYRGKRVQKIPQVHESTGILFPDVPAICFFLTLIRLMFFLTSSASRCHVSFEILLFKYFQLPVPSRISG
jgi:hypothetical protein